MNSEVKKTAYLVYKPVISPEVFDGHEEKIEK